MSRHFIWLPAALLAVTASTAVLAKDPSTYRLADSAGKQVGNARVSLIGRAGSTRTNANGEFRLEPEPQPPFELAVFAQSGAFEASTRRSRCIP